MRFGPGVPSGRKRGRRHAPEKPQRPSPHPEIVDLHPEKPSGRQHAQGRFKPPPHKGGVAVHGEHAADKPFDDWLHERMFHPKPQDELRVLGFEGASALQRARENMKSYIFQMHHPQPHWEQGNPKTLGKGWKPDETGLTPEEIAAGKEALGTKPSWATKQIHDTLAGIHRAATGHDIADLAARAERNPVGALTIGTVDPRTYWNLPKEARKAVRSYEEHPSAGGALDVIGTTSPLQAGLGKMGPRAYKGKVPRSIEAKLDAIPDEQIPTYEAAVQGIEGGWTPKQAADALNLHLPTLKAAHKAGLGIERIGSNIKPGMDRESLFPTAHKEGDEWVARLNDGQGNEIWTGGTHAARKDAMLEALAQREKHPPGVKIEVPKISGGAPGKITAEERRVTYHGLSTWFPTSPSRPTAYAQRLLDRFSEHLAGPVDVLRASNDWKRYRLGQALTPLSARGRVPKVRATRVQRLEARRARGRTAEQRRVLRSGGHFMGVPTNNGEQMAHAIWMQLPESHRNVEGLKLWRQRFLHHSLADLSDMSETGFSARVASYIQEAEKRMSQEFAAGDVTTARRTQAEIADLRAVQQDIPGRISDVQDEITKFDKLIEKPPKYNPAVADAAATLNREAEEIMVREGLLDPEEAAIRAGKVAEGLGLEPSGEEVYLHHGMTKGKTPMGAGAGLGRLRPPEGAGQHLGLVLARSGRVRLSLEPVIEHWQQAQSYELQGFMRDDLAAMGTPLSEKPGFRPGPDDLVVNPEGRPKLRSWQRDPEVVALEESLDPEGFHIKNLEEALRSSIAEGADRDRLIQEAIDAGQLDQLKVVPRDVFNRYVGQYKDYATVVPGMEAVRKSADAVNSMVYLSLIYANPGYIPANLVANFLMHFAQAGIFAPVDLARTIQILQTVTAEGRGSRMQRLRDQLRSEIGHGPTVEAAADIKVAQSVSRGVAMIPDDPVRMSAFIHEAARLGVIPKMSPVLREKDIVALEKLLNDKSQRGRLNDIQDRAVQAMVDFERLGPKERAILKRVMFVWSWTRGGTRYPFRFALDHPGRSAVLAYLFSGAPGAPQNVQDKIHQFMPTVQKGMPPWLEGALHVGTKEIGGKVYPVVLPTRQISPVSQPWDIFRTAMSAPGAQTVGELLNPAIPAGWHILNKESPYGRKVGSYGEAAWQEWQRLQPAANLAGGLISPPTDTKLYPEDKTRWGRLKRSLRVFPYAVDLQEAEKARVRSGMVSTSEAAFQRFKDDAKKYLKHDPPDYVLHQAKVKLDLDHRIYKEARDKDRHIDYFKAVKIVADVYEKERGQKIDTSRNKYQTQAHAQYLSLIAALYPAYSAYQSYIDRHIAYERGKQTANG